MPSVSRHRSSTFLNRLGVDGDAGDLRKPLLHTVFQRCSDVVNVVIQPSPPSMAQWQDARILCSTWRT